MLQERNEIKISDTSYISIGDYMDNNDGIMYYWPENKDVGLVSSQCKIQ